MGADQTVVAVGTITCVIATPPAKLRPSSTELDAQGRLLAAVVREQLNALCRSPLMAGDYSIEANVEVLAVEYGCIKAKLAIVITVVGAVGAFVAKYPDLRDGAQALFKDGHTVVDCYHNGHTVKDCAVNLLNNSLAERLYGPVKNGETLGEIAAIWNDTDYTDNQFMRAVLQENPDAFINGDIGRLKAGSVLKFPGANAFRGIKR